MCPVWNRRLFLLYLLHLRRKYRSKSYRRKYWLHPIVRVRTLEGSFYTLFEKIENDETKFFNYFRMSTTTFNYLVAHISGCIQGQDTVMRLCIPPKEMLAVTIRYLASGATFTDLHYSYRLGTSTIAKIVRKVCCALWDCLTEEQLPKPTEERWRAISNGFNKSAHFPHCVSAVDGKHVRIFKFPGSGSMNMNYKHFFSMVLMAVVDSNYRFVYVDIGAYGKDCDSSVFKNTVFYELLFTGRLNLPPPCPLTENSHYNMPFVLVGDEAFSLSENIMRPYGGRNLSEKKRVFNYRLCRARRYVECAFGILSNKWRIFHRPLNVSKQFAKDIVKACVILHNLVRERDGSQKDDLFTTNGLLDVVAARSTRATKNTEDIRDGFAEYFVSPEGALPWQNSKI